MFLILALLLCVFPSAEGHLPFSSCSERGGACVSGRRCRGWVDVWDKECTGDQVCCRPHRIHDDDDDDEDAEANDHKNTGIKVSDSTCGIIPVLENKHIWKHRKARVVGGDPAVVGEWPWQVALHARGRHICGGSLVAPNWVITAAHCFRKYSHRSVVVILGQHHKNKKTGNEKYRRITRRVQHRRFTTGFGNPYDIALLELERPVDINGAYIRTICLPSNRSVVFDEFDHCYVTGWGSTRNTGDARVLRHIQVDIVPRDECNRSWRVIKEANICAGDGVTGACKGDSGGPLVCYEDGRYVLAGITSWGSTTCKKPGYPDVYVRVASFLDWIYPIIQT